MRIYDSVLDVVGKTPLIRLRTITGKSKGTLVVKYEAANPCGSVKDRIAIHMIDDAERTGKLKPGGTIIECTSGNTGLGLAQVAVVRGYHAIFTMPDKVSAEKSKLLKAFGAEVILAPTAVEPEDPRSYYSIAKRLNDQIENSFFPNQYENPMNADTHVQSTGPEIWDDTDGKITHFVAGMGTGGTISGCGRYLKSKNPDIKIIGADPVGSLYTQYFETGELGDAHTYKVEGIGEDILPGNMDFSIVDRVIQVGDLESFRMARRLAKEEAIFSGSSAGCAMEAAVIAAADLEEGDLMVVIIPDTGERYLSKVYDEDWLQRNQLLDSGIDLSVGSIIMRSGTHDLVTVESSAQVRDAVGLLREHNISQVPVVKDGELVGSLRESQVIQVLLGGQEALNGQVEGIMEPPFPCIPDNTPVHEIVENFSKGIPAVLVEFKNGTRRILTKWDVLHSVSLKRS